MCGGMFTFAHVFERKYCAYACMHHGHVRTHGADVHRAHSARGRKTENDGGRKTMDGGSVEEIWDRELDPIRATMLRPMVASSAGSPWNGLAMSRRARCSEKVLFARQRPTECKPTNARRGVLMVANL